MSQVMKLMSKKINSNMYEVQDETGLSRGLFHISHLKSYLSERMQIRPDATWSEQAGLLQRREGGWVTWIHSQIIRNFDLGQLGIYISKTPPEKSVYSVYRNSLNEDIGLVIVEPKICLKRVTISEKFQINLLQK
jgi:hypothetical protein